ncbi:MAG: OmpA family protein, partial [Gammaproteobacteria bacterium]|nr:OmpA family protein [Gammaproteobacteria bacterium]
VNFQFDQSELTDISKIKLLRIIDKVKSTSGVQIMISTFTDNLGSDTYNMALSQRRAAALELLLVKHGISSDTILAKGMGEKNPLADNETPAGQAINRRGEFTFTTASATKPEAEDTITPPVKMESSNSEPTPTESNFEVDSNGVLVMGVARLTGGSTGADDDPSISIESSKAENGITATNADGDLVYRPIEGYAGTDVVTYTASDSAGQTSTSAVFVKVSESAEIDLSKTQFVSFQFSKSELTDASRVNLLRIIDSIKSTPGVQTLIRTYTDSLGSDTYNLALSQRRAEAMKSLLSKHGISSDSIFAEGMGEKDPLADNQTPAGQAINRRGEFIFTIATDAN